MNTFNTLFHAKIGLWSKIESRIYKIDKANRARHSKDQEPWPLKWESEHKQVAKALWAGKA